MNKDKIALARPLVEQALALDPGNANAMPPGPRGQLLQR